VEKDGILGASRVRPGDMVIAMASSGLHSNGYSLVREIVRQAGLDLEQDVPELGRPLGEELIVPSRIYARDCLALAAACGVHAYAHITGGGLAGNLARVLPPGVDAVLDRATWTPPAIFGVLAAAGAVPAAEMERVFNMGAGMTAVVARDDTDQALSILESRGVAAWVLGEVTPGTGEARLNGSH
jgi:phosphoribosylformylglycinamidine cyclo-ligase